MNAYATALIFCGMMAVVVSGALRTQGAESDQARYLIERLSAQKKAAQKQRRAAWIKSGDPIEKKQRAAPDQCGRSLPERRIDIKPLFSKGCDGAFENLVFEITQMPRPLFDAFVRSARRRFEEKSGQITLWDLTALPFDTPKDRAAYFSHCKGKDSWLRRVKIEKSDAKIPIHQISDESAKIIFDEESARRVIAKRARLKRDAAEPFWKSGDLLKLKTKNPLWRDWIQTGLDIAASREIIEQTCDGSAVVERVISEN